MQILAVESAADDVQPPEIVKALVDALPFIGAIMGDSAYDKFNAYIQIKSSPPTDPFINLCLKVTCCYKLFIGV